MSTSIFGSVVLRTEDPRFIRGRGRYTDNVDAEGALDASFVRSMMAHARVVRVDVSASAHMPGVAAVFTAADLDLAPQPPSGSVSGPFERQVLVRDTVRFVGEAIAVVLAESLGQAQDAAESVQVEYEPLPAVVGSEAALAAGAPLLFPEASGKSTCLPGPTSWSGPASRTSGSRRSPWRRTPSSSCPRTTAG